MADIYSWGYVEIPTFSGSISDLSFIVDNLYTTLYLKTNGTLWIKGRNYHGALGIGSEIDHTIIEYVQIGSDTWTHIVCTYGSALAIKSNGTLWVWGDNTYGQLGLGDTTHRYEPVQVGSAAYIDISSAGNDSFALRNDGALFSCGRNKEGTCGLGNTTSPITTWTQVSGTYKKISCNNRRGMALDNNDNLWIWGEDLSTVVGSGSNIDQLSPYKTSTKTWSKIYAHYNIFAIDTEGFLYGFGDNYYGELGVGDTSSRTDFTLIGISQWADIFCSGYISLAIKSNGETYICGRSGYCGLLESSDITLFTILPDLYISQYFGYLSPALVVSLTVPVFWTEFKDQREII